MPPGRSIVVTIPKPLVARLPAELNPFLAQLGHRRVEVVAREREFVLRR